MATQYYCKNENRRSLVRETRDQNNKPILNGMDYLEVASPDQTRLTVYFIHNLPGQPDGVPPLGKPLQAKNFVIKGGVRIQNVKVMEVSSSGNELTIKVNIAGDFSIYTLKLVAGTDSDLPPAGFDPQLAEIEFSFKVECPSEFDCKQDKVCPTEKFPEPLVDYVAKDYTSFRRLMLDRLATLMPEWKERNPADLGITLVELLAYVGDHLSYYQDAVATEAYLGTARKRVSMRRHARLLDYRMHDGCNSRAWLHVEVEPGGGADGLTLNRATKLLTKGVDETVIVHPDDLEKIIASDRAEVFETMHDVTLYADLNEIDFYTWSDAECCLPKGSTCATLEEKSDLSSKLKPGAFLLFEEKFSPTTLKEADADSTHRQVVRLTSVEAKTDPLNNIKLVEIKWAEEDALLFPLCISVRDKVDAISVARGNIVLADHGRTIENKALIPAVVPRNECYRPQILDKPLTYATLPHLESAASAMKWDVRQALPRIELKTDKEEWTPEYDLLNCSPFQQRFVVEMESDGTATLRFGDDVHGRMPTEGTAFTASYRIGNGSAGNVGTEVISRIVWHGNGISKVRNPLPASGGIDPEPMEQVRLYAPYAFRRQERAVTVSDYAMIAERHSEVQKAAATIRWTGSWYTVFVTIDRKLGREVDAEFKQEMLAFLNCYRLAGYDVEINGPNFVPLDIILEICVKPGYLRSHVKQSLLEIFSNQDLSDGRHGFFHPDNFTFGQPLYLSQIYQKAMTVVGVASVNVTRFNRWGKLANQELEHGVLWTGKTEIIRLDNDPNFPENGKIDFHLMGGL